MVVVTDKSCFGECLLKLDVVVKYMIAQLLPLRLGVKEKL